MYVVHKYSDILLVECYNELFTESRELTYAFESAKMSETGSPKRETGSLKFAGSREIEKAGSHGKKDYLVRKRRLMLVHNSRCNFTLGVWDFT